MMTFQVDIAQRSKERPAWIVLQQVACLNWLLGESPSHPAHIPSSISVTHPLSTLYPRCSHDFLAIVFESTVPPLSHKIKFTTKWFKLLPAANSIGKWQHLELQEEEEVGKEKEMFPMCTICSSLYVTLSLSVSHNLQDRPLIEWYDWRGGNHSPAHEQLWGLGKMSQYWEESRSGKLLPKSEPSSSSSPSRAALNLAISQSQSHSLCYCHLHNSSQCCSYHNGKWAKSTAYNTNIKPKLVVKPALSNS